MMIDYTLLNKQLEALIEGETDPVGILANAAALLKETTGWFWVGFYLVRGNELLLGPFQGPVACYRIGYGKGVCGAAWAQQRSLVVPDVEEFPGHIACSSLSRSEIVIPIFADGTMVFADGTMVPDDSAAPEDPVAPEGTVIGVLDIDSTEPGTFTEADRIGLEAFCAILARSIGTADAD